MKTLENICWFLFGGLLLSLLWIVFGLLWCITLIGIPVGCNALILLGLCYGHLESR